MYQPDARLATVDLIVMRLVTQDDSEDLIGHCGDQHMMIEPPHWVELNEAISIPSHKKRDAIKKRRNQRASEEAAFL